MAAPAGPPEPRATGHGLGAHEPPGTVPSGAVSGRFPGVFGTWGKVAWLTYVGGWMEVEVGGGIQWVSAQASQSQRSTQR